MQVGVVSQFAGSVPVAGNRVLVDPTLARVFQARLTAPVAWLVAVGTVWQALHAKIGRAHV